MVDSKVSRPDASLSRARFRQSHPRRSRTALDPLPPLTRTTRLRQTPHSSLSLVSKWLAPAWTMNLSSPTIDFAFNTASPNPLGSGRFTHDNVHPSIIL